MDNTTHSFIEIDELILRYRSGDSEASEELLIKFEPLLSKYFKLLRTGRYNARDPEIRKFLGMCGKTDIDRTASLLAWRLRRLEREDISQECSVALLETALKYLNISGAYKYVLHRRVMAILKSDVPEVPYPDTIQMEELVAAPPQNVDIDSKWIEGDTADLFSDLTKEDRLLIKMVWHDYLSEENICKQLEISRGELKRRKNKIREALSGSLGIGKR